MAFTHEGWTLYSRDVTLKGGRKQTIYYFSKRTPKSGSPCDKPDNMIVGVNKRTGLPYLKKRFPFLLNYHKLGIIFSTCFYIISNINL